ISFTEALQHFQSTELFKSRGKVRAPGRQGILAALFCCFCGPPQLQPQLWGEQELVLAMAQCALDDSERVHMRILQTIYQQLTCSRLGCPRYGAHWEELGFQGRRGSNPLSVEIPRPIPKISSNLQSPTQWRERRVFHLSFRNAGILVLFQNFPFCIMSVNITRIVIQALQEERLSRECNRQQQVIGVLNDLYAAAFLQLSRLWKRQQGTITDAAFFLKELELSTKKKPRQLLKSLEAYLS
ncbi:ELMD3 protein, partial [Anthoscopus minutus]|nr:ELMD3 protein [Anthoscopus minutus]